MLHLQDDRADAVEQNGEDEVIEEEGEFDLPVGHFDVVDTRIGGRYMVLLVVLYWANVEKSNSMRYMLRD